MKKSFLLVAFVSLFQIVAWSNEFDDRNYINEYGRLKLVGVQLSTENGDPVQLKGWSSENWKSGGVDCHDSIVMKLAKANGLNLYRSAMSVADGSDIEVGIRQTKDFIDQAANLGLYYVCDWNVSTPGDPNDSVYAAAPAYFDEISSYVKSKGYRHVIYEICGEPSNVSWSSIKDYADKVLPVIERNDSGACVIVGTPQWCQNIHEAESSPITKYPGLNLLYAFHYNSCSHSQFLSRFGHAAMSIPLFVSEFSVASLDGSETVDSRCLSEAESLMRIANGEQKISNCMLASELVDGASSQNCDELALSQLGSRVLSSFCCGGPESSNTDYRSDNGLVSPNPSDGTFVVGASGRLVVANLVGEVVFSANVEANRDVRTGLPAGNYIVTLKAVDAVRVAKLVVK